MLRLTARYGPVPMGAEPLLHLRRPEREGATPAGIAAPSAPNIAPSIQAFLHEIHSPLSLGSFATGIYLARFATAAFLARAGAWGWGTALGAQAVGLGTEIAGMTLSRRLGAQVFFGATDSWQAQDLGSEMLAMAGPFALLRGSHLLFAKLNPLLQIPSGSVLPGAVKLGGDLAAVMGGEAFNRAAGLQPGNAEDRSLLYSGLSTLAHMRLAGLILAPATSRSLDRILQGHELRLRSASAPMMNRPVLEDGALMVVATAGFTPTPRAAKPLWETRLHMMGDEGPGGSAPPKAGASQPPPPSNRGEAIREELQTRVAELHQEAARSTLKEKMDQAAAKLQRVLENYRQDPRSLQDQNLQRDLSAVRENLSQAQKLGRSLQERLTGLRVFLDQVRKSDSPGTGKEETAKTPAAGLPPMVAAEAPSPVGQIFSGLFGDLAVGARERVKRTVARWRGAESAEKAGEISTASSELSSEVQRELKAVQEQVEVKEQQGDQMQVALRSLEALRRYLAIAAERGLSDHSQWSLNRRLVKVQKMFPNFRWEGISWAQSTGEVAARRNGVALGLGIQTPAMKIDTTLARRLRGEGNGENREIELDSDLEVLQQCLLLGAGWRGSVKQMGRPLDRLVADYGLRDQPEATARLAAVTVNQLVSGKISKDQLISFLESKTQETRLDNLLLVLRGRILSGRPLPDSLATFIEEASVPNYFLSSLGLVLQSSGTPERFIANLKSMEGVPGAGFHPSVAWGLYGAIYGEVKLPIRYFAKDFSLDTYLNRAQQEFFSGIAEVR